MEEEIYVSCHAPSLSLLLFETARSFHDQKGLLIGEICSEVISEKTDENEISCEHKTAIYLEHCIPIEDEDIIGNAGYIDKAKLKKFTDILQNKIVGWYSFRRNSPLIASSLSETLIHQSLLQLLPNIKCQYFVACFMSSYAAANMSTHTFNHVFMTYNPSLGRFQSLRLKINTLSDKGINSHGYLKKNTFPISSSFEKIMNYSQKEETPVRSVLEIHEKVSELLKHTDKKLQNIDNHRLQLEQEVEALKRKLGTAKKVGTILVTDPERLELKVKTVRYDPSIKYRLIRKENSLNMVTLKPENFMSAEDIRTNCSVNVKTCGGQMMSEERKCSCAPGGSDAMLTTPNRLRDKINNCIINSCASEDSHSSENNSNSNNDQQTKSVEH